MAPNDAGMAVTLGFVPRSVAVPDVDHPGLLRVGPRASAPYAREDLERHRCSATDSSRPGSVQPDLLGFGFDTVDLSRLDDLQTVLTGVREAGHVTEADAAGIRAALDGATLRCSSGPTLRVLHLADEGLIMRTAGPNGLSVVGPRSTGMNGHGPATSVHADQDVYGTPLTQLMDGRAPELFRHDSPDGANHDARLMLLNLWIPLQQITQPLVLADGHSVDRRRHQLRYGLPTQSFLERDEEMATNDIWTFLHDPGQRWYLRSEMDHRSAYVFNTLSTAHGSCALPGEDLAEALYRSLEEAEAAVAKADPDALRSARPPDASEPPPSVPPALSAAIAEMAAVLEAAPRDAAAVCGPRAEGWLSSARAARRRVVRMSLEMRMVASLDA
ncbi:MAG: hypothetical protein ACLGI8_12475 [Acidimicrobiia bacterium]